jgi:hypothetical protein
MCEILCEKQTRSKRTGDLAEVVECLSGKFEALNSNPSTTKKKHNNSNDNSSGNNKIRIKLGIILANPVVKRLS